MRIRIRMYVACDIRDDLQYKSISVGALARVYTPTGHTHLQFVSLTRGH